MGFFDFLTGSNNFGTQAGYQIPQDTVSNAASQNKSAEEYQANLPGYLQTQSQIGEEQAGNKAQSDDIAINASSSKRGLLYSGLNQGAKAQNRSNLASALMQRRSKMNAAGQAQSMAYNANAAKAGIGVADLQNQAAQNQYQGNVYGGRQNSGILGGLLQGGL